VNNFLKNPSPINIIDIKNGVNPKDYIETFPITPIKNDTKKIRFALSLFTLYIIKYKETTHIIKLTVPISSFYITNNLEVFYFYDVSNMYTIKLNK